MPSIVTVPGRFDSQILARFRKNSGLDTKLRGIKKSAQRELGTVWLAAYLKEPDPVGICRLHLAPTHVAFLSELMVQPSYRCCGIGSALIRHTEAYCAMHLVERLALEYTASSRRFYESLGYIQDPVFSTVVFKNFAR